MQLRTWFYICDPSPSDVHSTSGLFVPSIKNNSSIRSKTDGGINSRNGSSYNRNPYVTSKSRGGSATAVSALPSGKYLFIKKNPVIL